jgi:hypothetical protein
MLRADDAQRRFELQILEHVGGLHLYGTLVEPLLK